MLHIEMPVVGFYLIQVGQSGVVIDREKKHPTTKKLLTAQRISDIRPCEKFLKIVTTD
jgi:hypothetical protein